MSILFVGLCNSSYNCWFEIILLWIADLFGVAKVSGWVQVTAPPEDFYQKIYKPLKQDLFDNHHISEFFAISNALSHNTLSEAVFLGNSLESP